MLEKIKISVIIPTYNRKRLLSRAIHSVLKQTYSPLEIIVIDDGSTDETDLLVTKEFPQIKYFKQSNFGISVSRNTGIKHSQGNWIAFLDSDDEWLSKKLHKQVETLTQYPEYKICHTNEIWIRNGKRVNPKKKHKKYGGDIFEKCLPLCVISPSSVLIQKSVFQNFGYFDTTLPACEDYDMWLRICAFLPVLYISEELIIKYGGHEDQLSHKYWGMDRFRVHALSKIVNSTKVDRKKRIAAKEMLIKKLEILINGAQKRVKSSAELNHYLKDLKLYKDIII